MRIYLYMGLIVDTILIAIVVLNVFIGYKRGLIKVVFSIFAFIIALIATLVLVKPISYLIIDNTAIDENIKAVIIKNNMSEENEHISDNDDIEDNNSNESNYIQQYIKDKISDTTEEAKNKAIETTAETISKKIIEILTGVLMFITIRIVLIMLKFVSNQLAKVPIIKQCNEVGGIIYGLIKAILLIYLVLTIIFIVTSIKGNGVVHDAIQESYLTNYLYNNNMVVNYCLLNKNLL